MDDEVMQFKTAIMSFKHAMPKTVNMQLFDNLSMADMIIFWHMHHIAAHNSDKDYLAISDLVKNMPVSKAAVTQNINKLEDKGLVKRITLKSDRRATYVCFTQQGKDLYKIQDDKINGVMAEIVKRMGSEDAMEFVRLLNKLKQISCDIAAEKKEEAQKNETAF